MFSILKEMFVNKIQQFPMLMQNNMPIKPIYIMSKCVTESCLDSYNPVKYELKVLMCLLHPLFLWKLQSKSCTFSLLLFSKCVLHHKGLQTVIIPTLWIQANSLNLGIKCWNSALHFELWVKSTGFSKSLSMHVK